MARIVIISPQGRDRRQLQEHNTLGRHPNNTHQVLDRVVSKEHCHIDLVEGRYRLRDLGSLNGTYLNGQRVSECFLREGDEITMGGTRIVFEAGHAEGTDRTNRKEFPAREIRVVGNKVTMIADAGDTADRIQTKLDALVGQNFLSEKMIENEESLRQDYERLRASYEVTRAIALEHSIDNMANKILDVAFELLAADRGVVLLYDADGQELTPRGMRSRRGSSSPEDFLISSTVIDEVLRDRAGVLSHDAALDARFQSAKSVIMQGIRSTMSVPLIHAGQVFGVMTLDSQMATHAFTEKDLQLFQTIANQAAIAIQNIRYGRKLEKEAITRERFQRLLSPAIAEQVISGAVEVKKGGELRQATILFTDIRGFTSMSESRSPQDVVDMLNEYFELMVEIIFDHEGTLDKFVGDEIMALFGAPVAHDDDPQRAAITALEMQDALKRFNAVRTTQGQPAIRIGIGINTGEVVAGYLGSSKALEYTVVGDAVNVGSRLCSLAKPGEILISAATRDALGDEFHCEELPPAQLKGKSLPLQVFRLRGRRLG